MSVETQEIGNSEGNRLRLLAWCAAGLLLLVPLVAMQFTDEVSWDWADFVVFGALLAGAGGAFELVVRQKGGMAYRVAFGLAIATVFLLLWVNGAVGIIGSENDAANLMFGGVVLIWAIGTVIARLKPEGMVWALIATAGAQVLVAVIALIAGFGRAATGWPLDILGATGLFVAMWLGSAWLFNRAKATGKE